MADTKIEWATKVWNPVTGCTKVSAGCRECYAKIVHDRRHKAYLEGKKLPEQYAEPFEIIRMHWDRMETPLHWKQPQRVFVNSMSDLFHEKIFPLFIEQVFMTMLTAKQHTFMVLTKRPKRMLELLSRPAWKNFVSKNIWLGVSVEDQKTADERIPLLLQTPAAVRFISAEPLLGKIIIPKISYRNIGPSCSSCSGTGYYHDNFNTPCPDCKTTGKNPTALHWLICGGESGKNARPMHPDLPRSLRDQCKSAGVPFFFKQWGEWFEPNINAKKFGEFVLINKDGNRWPGNNEFTFDGLTILMEKVGKKKAGRMLDGVEHNEFPKIL